MANNKEKSPAFQFYPKDFLSDGKVLVMSAEVVGLYIKLLCVDWLEDGFPEACMLKLGGYDWHDQFGNLRDDEGDSLAIAQLSDCFVPHPTKKGFITNPRLQKERKNQIERSLERSKSGEKGAKSKWNKDLRKIAQPSISHSIGDSSAINQPMAKDGSSSSSSSSLKEPSVPNLSHKPQEGKVFSYRLDPDNQDPGLSNKKIKKEKSPPGQRPETETYGPYKHVWLLFTEFDELCKKFGKEKVESKIISLDANIENGIKKYLQFKNHAACIRSWCSSDQPSKNGNHKVFQTNAERIQKENLEYLLKLEAEEALKHEQN